MSSCDSYLVFEDIFVIKATSSELTLLSKFLADLQRQFSAGYVSRICHNKMTNEYFAYVHVSNAEIAEKLQNISLVTSEEKIYRQNEGAKAMTKQPLFCRECNQFQEDRKVCRSGYHTNPRNKACSVQQPASRTKGERATF